ncbi:MAG: hypothetical protein AUG51_16950 [Acidobacteria bacterium 13_1_20CM_3_53_8]|nr:MAG: hypothetical protein AUG51_16950 [Acidobacteria bacterium 13_1_20CM_3_53_8]
MSAQLEQLKFRLFEDELLNPLRGHELSELESFVASLLLNASSQKPIGIKEIKRAVHKHLEQRISERRVKAIIRKLRKVHFFPILSHTAEPTGYWWSESSEQMKAFAERFQEQPLDQLHTLSKMVKHNYPELAGQLKFEDILD